jgi:hypothetical protein
MDLNATIDIIIRDLKEAGEIIDDLKKYPGVPELQVELAKSKCRSASEVIALFKNLPEKVPHVREEKSIVREETRQPVNSKETVVNEHVTEVHYKEVIEIRVPDASAEAIEKPVQTAIKTVEPLIIADQYSNRPESFNEKLGSHKHEDDILEILHTKPLQSLNDAIGINDKFLFIREIFGGNVDLYNQTIIKLESVRSLADARAVVISYTGDNAENEAVKQLLELIKRRFPSHE